MLPEVLSWLRTARNAWIAGKGEARARMLAELEIPSTQQDAVRPQLPQPIFLAKPSVLCFRPTIFQRTVRLSPIFFFWISV